jgi:hypothetical protein
MSDAGYRVRAAIFRRPAGGAVYYPSGRDSGSRKHGFPSVAPAPYRAPKEQVWTVSTFAQARDLVRELKLEHGDRVVVHIEPVETAAAEPRPSQTDLAELGNWPQHRRAQ